MSSVKATKKSAFSCEPCRRRKVKCGGEQPVCKRCASRSDDCIYKLNPTLSYTQRLEERIKELEEQLTLANKSPGSAAGSSSHSSPPVFGSVSSHDGQTSSQARSGLHSDEQGVARSFRGLKIDDRGGITYHGATSFFNLPSDRNGVVKNDVLAHSADSDKRRQRLVTNAWQQRALENLSDIPEPFQYLLNVHWCWVHPLFNFIYRPAFTRDMQTMGPYYSHTLLNTVLSHAVRWGKSDPAMARVLDDNYAGGSIFGKQARALLFDELSRGICSIPTVQALLLLSAQECSYGNSTQAWTYSGLALRLMDHLGILVDGQRYPGSVPLTEEDVEIRHRVFWSCYFWDKIICLYLGRSPSLQHTSVSPPQIIFDDSAENELWIPFGAPRGEAWKYPPATAHSASSFTSTCQLSVIFNEILIHMYDPLMQNTDAEIQECLQIQEVSLQQWWERLPHYLRIDPVSLPSLAPPSHIVTMNCLYHTFKILLYRPMLTKGKPDEHEPLTMRSYLVECVASATSILAIFDLFCRTFGIHHCILSLSYTLYIASSIFLLQVQAAPDDQQALRRLDYCYQALTQVKAFSPILGSALNLINREMSSMGIVLESSGPPSRQPLETGAHDVPLSSPPYAADAPGMQSQPAYGASPLFQQPWVDNFEPDSMTMDPAIFEAMSGFEPLSVRVGAIHDFDSNQS